VIVAVSDEGSSVRPYDKSSRIVESRIGPSTIRKSVLSISGDGRDRSIRIDATDRMIVLIRYIQPTVCIDLHIVGLIELSLIALPVCEARFSVAR